MDSLEKKWEVYAIKYAERNDRTRNDSFIFDDHAHEQHSIDYFIWVLKNNDQIVLVDTGYDQEEANRRNRPIIRSPSKAIRDFGINPEKISISYTLTFAFISCTLGLWVYLNNQRILRTL